MSIYWGSPSDEFVADYDSRYPNFSDHVRNDRQLEAVNKKAQKKQRQPSDVEKFEQVSGDAPMYRPRDMVQLSPDEEQASKVRVWNARYGITDPYELASPQAAMAVLSLCVMFIVAVITVIIITTYAVCAIRSLQQKVSDLEKMLMICLAKGK
jgi:hypothetical protein